MKEGPLRLGRVLEGRGQSTWYAILWTPHPHPVKNTGLSDGRAPRRGEVAGESIIRQVLGLDLEWSGSGIGVGGKGVGKGSWGMGGRALGSEVVLCQVGSPVQRCPTKLNLNSRNRRHWLSSCCARLDLIESLQFCEVSSMVSTWQVKLGLPRCIQSHS